MPAKDKEARLAYQREWYAKNNKRVIAKVNARKWKEYGGVCKNCGGPTIGETKGKAADYCGKPACSRAQRLAKRELFVEVAREAAAKTKRGQRRKLFREKKILTIEEIAKTF